MTDYRTDIYGRYASVFKNADTRFNTEAAEQWGRAYDHYLRGWLPRDKGTPIADIGCGSGRLLHFLVRRGYTDISGVDISQEQVQIARQVVADVTQGDVLDVLEARPGSYGLILGLDIVEHFQKDELPRFFRAVHGALAPGGRIVLQTPNADSALAMRVRYGDLTHEVCFGPGLLSSLLQLYGFGRAECRETGPVPFGYSAASTARSVIWLGLRQIHRAYNLVETGSAGSGILTRVFLASAVKT